MLLQLLLFLILLQLLLLFFVVLKHLFLLGATYMFVIQIKIQILVNYVLHQ